MTQPTKPFHSVRAAVGRVTAVLVAFATLAGLAALPAHAGEPSGYYLTVDASSPAALRATLHPIIAGHTYFPYSSSDPDTWNVLEDADEDPGNPANILDVYRNESMVKFGGGTGPYNREHTWPNSYGFTDDDPVLPDRNYPYTDCHALFLSHVGYNSDRGNKPYDTCAQGSGCLERTTIGGGSGSYPGNSNWFSAGLDSWETWVGRRGDVARAQLYLDVRYEGGTHPVDGSFEPDLILTDNRSLIMTSSNNETVAYHGMLSTILAWHEADQPDAKERRRNDRVGFYQGNRNPFVDHPEWVACLFASNCDLLVSGFENDFEGWSVVTGP